MIKPASHGLRSSPYVGGKPISLVARETGIAEAKIAKLASSENPLGMSDLAKAACNKAIHQLGRYPDPDSHALRSKLAEKFGLSLDQVVLGSGVNEILDLAAAAFLDATAECVYSQYGFIGYSQATQRLGAKHVQVEAKDFGHDLDGMLERCNEKTRVVFIANPNNPTGTYLEPAAIEAFLQKVPPHVVVVLYEAHNEYLPNHQQFDTVPWIKRFFNLLILRTFSKAYGMAELRVGYGLGQPGLISWISRVRPAFNVATPAQEAAIAALDDHAFLARTALLNAQGLVQLQQGLKALGIKTPPSSGNFFLAQFEDASAVDSYLLTQGFILRPVASYGLTTWLRISVGLPEENAYFLKALATPISKISDALSVAYRLN